MRKWLVRALVAIVVIWSLANVAWDVYTGSPNVKTGLTVGGIAFGMMIVVFTFFYFLHRWGGKSVPK